MSEHGPKPVLWSTLLLRIALLVVLLAALTMALAPKLANLFNPQRKLTTAGDPADIQLVGVVPDGDDVLLDGRGDMLGEKFDWPGKRTYTWPPGTMLREFLFELGPGLEDLEFNAAGTVRPVEKHSWIQSVTCAMEDERVLGPSGHRRVLFRATMHTNYWRRSTLFGSRPAPLEEIDLELHFFGKARGPAELNFDGPFAVGKTNSARESRPYWVVALTNSGPGNFEGLLFEMWWKGSRVGRSSQVFAYDTKGKRHRASFQNMNSSSAGGTNRFGVPGVAVENIAAITFSEEPRVKRFQNVLVKYPDRPPRPYSAALDRLATALGKTNTSPMSLEHYSPHSVREAMTVLECLPGQRNAISALATSFSSTNLSELTPAQREKLRGLAFVRAGGAPGYDRDMGLRLGLSGGWPEFLALALARLTNVSTLDRVHAANALAWTQSQIGTEHVPFVLAIARTNTTDNISSSLLSILQRAGAAGSNALMELTRADAPGLWWGAMDRLPRRAFEPVANLSPEMQERLWLTKELTTRPGSDTVRTAALARLPGLLTPELQRQAPGTFSSAFRRLERHADRATAMATITRFLRDLPPEQARSQPPSELIRQVNAWYGQDFGGLGGSPDGSSRAPESKEWPGVIEEVLEYCEKLQREGKVASEK